LLILVKDGKLIPKKPQNRRIRDEVFLIHGYLFIQDKTYDLSHDLFDINYSRSTTFSRDTISLRELEIGNYVIN